MVLTVLLLVTACATGVATEEGFRFPIVNGNIAAGQQAFLELGCHQCHTVRDVMLPSWNGDSPLSLELGGEILHVKTYGELITSIINPNHVISEKYLDRIPREQRKRAASPMPFKEEMTVRQLIDLVTFLNSRYILLEPDYYPDVTGLRESYR